MRANTLMARMSRHAPHIPVVSPRAVLVIPAAAPDVPGGAPAPSYLSERRGGEATPGAPGALDSTHGAGYTFR